MNEPATPRASADEPLLRVILWLIVFLVAFFWMHESWYDALVQKEGYYADFSQEWLSARNYWSSMPVYTPQSEALLKHTGERPVKDDAMLPWNVHPPASIIFALPFGSLPNNKFAYRHSHLIWTAAMSACLLAALIVAIRVSGRNFQLGDALMLGALLFFCSPLQTQLFQGQLNGIIAMLVVLAWAADKRERYFQAGVLIGLAAAIKIVPAYLFLYWLVQRRWQALSGGVAGFVLLNCLALAMFGLDSFRVYVEIVAPSVTNYRSSWDNVSISGFWFKLFDPNEQVERVQALARLPWLANGLSFLCQLIVTMIVSRRCVQARTREQRDHALGLAVIGMLLVSPITWSHYFLVLIMPLCVKSAVPYTTIGRWLFWGAVTVLWLPISWTTVPTMGTHIVKIWNVERGTHALITPAQVLTGFAIQTYALTLLFALYWYYFPQQAICQRDYGIVE